MRRLLSITLLGVSLWAHSGAGPADNTNPSLRYGLYADLMYRSDDLYPYGIEGSAGFENHGQPEKIELTHIGAYFENRYANFLRYGAEINRHAGSKERFDELTERLYVGYIHPLGSLTLGRDAGNVSFVRERPWGYGFATMPLAVDSFFDGTYFGDGLFAAYRPGNFDFALDVMQDRYTKTTRATLRAAWQTRYARLIGYVQQRERSQARVDYTTAKHTHSHGAGCDTMTSSERCFERKNRVFGLGAFSEFERFELQGEYLMLQSEGNIRDALYRIDSESTIHTLYLQARYLSGNFEAGARAEWFIFSNRYDGDGAAHVADAITTEYADDTQYLHTLMAGYRIGRYHHIVAQGEFSQKGSALRLGYRFSVNLPQK